MSKESFWSRQNSFIQMMSHHTQVTKVTNPPPKNRVRCMYFQSDASLDADNRSANLLAFYRRMDSLMHNEFKCLGCTVTTYKSHNPKWATLFTTNYQVGMNSAFSFAHYNGDFPLANQSN